MQNNYLKFFTLVLPRTCARGFKVTSFTIRGSGTHHAYYKQGSQWVLKALEICQQICYIKASWCYLSLISAKQKQNSTLNRFKSKSELFFLENSIPLDHRSKSGKFWIVSLDNKVLSLQDYNWLNCLLNVLDISYYRITLQDYNVNKLSTEGIVVCALPSAIY